ncbi:MAG: SpoIIE family protein phosphatase [Campylobacterales bacterium]|nr:SpoIIE family protein phosphatase [Campylobacterales bacterium]
MESTKHNSKKLKLLNLVVIISFIYATSLAVLNFFEITQYIDYKTPLMVSYAIINGILYYLLHKSEQNQYLVLTGVLFFALLVFTITMVIYPKSEIRFMWYFFTIMIAYYIGDRKVGIITSVTAFVLILFINLYCDLGFDTTTITSVLIGILFISQISNYFVSILDENEKNLKDAKKEIELAHKHTKESIEYASLIQSAIIPNENLLKNYFDDYFVYWSPKDTVGGDLWLFDELRNDKECLLFIIDCTGHGVPGAFVTMIVKAIEREIITNIINNTIEDVNPATLMGYFNKTMKTLLKQDDPNSISNAGWDGAIIYYNQEQNILKFAGAQSNLFYVDCNDNFHMIKGNKYSVGYKKCDIAYKYDQTILQTQKGMKFYCTTDGYVDQNGGEKDFPFGKKRFENIIVSHHDKPMKKQKQIFIDELLKYQNFKHNNERNDDITLIGFKL